VLAQILTEFGSPEKFKLINMPKPEVRPGSVLVKLAATSVNRVDTKIRKGLPIGPDLPAVLGADVAGVVESVGKGVIGFAPGDEVYGCAGGIKGHGGTLAEYIAADARLLAHKPVTLTMREAAALPLVSIAAWEGLQRGALSQSEHILVHGGLGGVGHIAIQLAKTLGARVATTIAGTDDAAIAARLGADDTIDYREEDVDAYVSRLTAGRGFDLVFDTVGGGNLWHSFAAAKASGRVVTTNACASYDLSAAHAKDLSLSVIFALLPMLHGHGHERHGCILRDVAKLVDAKKLRPLIDDSYFTLETAPDAHRRIESGNAKGKVVIEVALAV
jgi:NADPH:quinone reductase